NPETFKNWQTAMDSKAKTMKVDFASWMADSEKAARLGITPSVPGVVPGAAGIAPDAAGITSSAPAETSSSVVNGEIAPATASAPGAAGSTSASVVPTATGVTPKAGSAPATIPKGTSVPLPDDGSIDDSLIE